MMPPNLPTLGTKIKCVIAEWIALIMEDDGCRSTFAKATNINIIKAVAKLSCITHLPN